MNRKILLIDLLFIIVLTACGQQQDFFLGSWVNISNEHDTVTISKKDDTYLVQRGETLYTTKKADYGSELIPDNPSEQGQVVFSFDPKSGLLSAGIKEDVFTYKRRQTN